MNSDFKELLKLFNDYKIRYLVVGGHAVMKYTEPRYTNELVGIIFATDRRRHPKGMIEVLSWN
jgi:hypothetical protein